MNEQTKPDIRGKKGLFLQEGSRTQLRTIIGRTDNETRVKIKDNKNGRKIGTVNKIQKTQRRLSK